MDMSNLSDWDVKKIEIENIKRMAAEKDVAGLVEVLRYGSRQRPSLSLELRWQAARALGRLGDARALAPLMEALQEKNGSLRGNAAEALGEIGDARAVGPLIEALKDEDKDLCLKAAKALGEIGDAIKGDIARTGGCVGELAATATEALGDIGDESAVPALTEILGVAKGTSLEDHVRYAFKNIERKQMGER